MAVPNTFASATSAIPLANLDANFAYYDAGFSLSGSTVTFAGAITLTSGTANGVPYLNASKVLTSGAALTFNGTVLTSSFAGPVAATTLSASSTVSGAGFSTYLASPPAIGGTAAAAGTFTAIVGTSLTNSALTATRVLFAGTAGLIQDDADLTFNGTILTSTGFAGPLNGTVGATTPAAGAFTTLTTSSTVTLNGGTANGVAYLDGSKVLTTGSALVFDGSNLGLGVTPSAWPGQGVNYDVLQAGVSAFANVGDLQAEVSYNQYVESGTGTRNYITSNPALFYRIGNTAHSWFTAPSGTAGNAITFTQAMTLDASGNLLVGTTSATGFQSGIVSQVDAGGPGVYARQLIGHSNGTGTGEAYAIYLYNGSAIGSITQFGTTSVLYNTTSDQRLKENIQDAAPASALIDSLQVRQYDWKSDGSHQRYGFVAQELVTVAPEAVHQPADPEEMMAVDYSKLVPMLVKEIQDLRKRLAALEAA